MRQPVLGNWENGHDNVEIKNIDILGDDEETVDNTIVATEWFAELCYAGHWRVNPDWLAAVTAPPPVDAPAEPAA